MAAFVALVHQKANATAKVEEGTSCGGRTGERRMAFAERREMINLSFLNAIAGGGKSYCALQDAHSGVRQGGRVLYIAPTIALLEEAADTFRAFGSEIEPEVIHNATAQFVAPAILAAPEPAVRGGQVSRNYVRGFRVAAVLPRP